MFSCQEKKASLGSKRKDSSPLLKLFWPEIQLKNKEKLQDIKLPSRTFRVNSWPSNLGKEERKKELREEKQEEKEDKKDLKELREKTEEKPGVVKEEEEEEEIDWFNLLTENEWFVYTTYSFLFNSFIDVKYQIDIN